MLHLLDFVDKIDNEANVERGILISLKCVGEGRSR
jgi:hypothetical protein